ncbi:hypothetical protein C2E23DRAFT_739013, partial [Lenzites betulinus]
MTKQVKHRVTIEEVEDEDSVIARQQRISDPPATAVGSQRGKQDKPRPPPVRKPARWVAGRRWPPSNGHSSASETPTTHAKNSSAINGEHDRERYIGPDAEEHTKDDLFEIPVTSVTSDDNNANDIYTRTSEPFKAQRVKAIVDAVQIGEDVTEAERKEITKLIAEFADCFALSVKEVTPVPGAIHKLNVPPDATFSKRIHQKPLTPPQREYVHKKIDELVEAGAIEPCTPDEVKCIAPITLAHKAH